MEKILFSVAILAFPAIVIGHPDGRPVGSAGVPADGGRTCSACHSMPALDKRGELTVVAGPYTPGITQKIRITLTHPEASRWAFQLTVRAMNDESKSAGRLIPNNDVRVLCGPDGTTQSPCAPGALEYAAQVSSNSETHGKTWELDWAPPATENGRIRLYVSALAANNNSAATGDYTYTAVKEIEWVGGCPITSRPGSLQIQDVVNAGSFDREAGISPNSLITIKGLEFADSSVMRVAGPGDYVDGQFPTFLGCLSVLIGSNPNDAKPVPLTFVGKDQINAQVPDLGGATSVTVQVVRNPGRDNEFKSPVWTGVPVRAFSPAFFMFSAPDPNKKSIAARLHPTWDIVADPSIVPGGQIAKPGDIVLLYGTGFGATDPAYPAGALPADPARLREEVTITIAGITLRPGDEIQYAGLTPQSISGLYQFNVKIPDTVPDGDLPVTIRIGGFQTQDGATIPVKRR